jgi:hypothetical protein
MIFTQPKDRIAPNKEIIFTSAIARGRGTFEFQMLK